ncbi:MAG: GAF domain-containing protein [Chloroflexi bacterium]|nr:MAG: GAF domain-containing protein [Chloroflexota bacterium]
MENIPKLKELVCLLSCQPRDLDTQLPAALNNLLDVTGCAAAGICWFNAEGSLQLQAQMPEEFALEAGIRQTIIQIPHLSAPRQGQNGVSWLVVPMKVAGEPKGRLWLVDESPARCFTRDECEFIMMMGNQLALALENSRLYDDVKRLAARRAELLRRVIAAQDERCRRISRDLHDEISQSLAALALDMEAMQVAAHSPGINWAGKLDSLHPRVVNALKEINRIILDLRPTLLEDLGLLPALKWFAGKRLEETGTRIHVRTTDPPPRLPAHLETTLYRVGQEAITNIAKHARAQNVWLKMEQTDSRVTLIVRDDGDGFDLNTILANTDAHVGLGLFGMEERTNLIGGRFSLRTAPGEGTRVAVTIPLTPEEAYATDSRSAG